MTVTELESVVAKHEMQYLELKESFNVECIETACAFANASGGYIVVGIDNAGCPSKRQLRFEGLRDYENKISTATEPSVAVDAEKVSLGMREVVVLKVAENPLKPVAYKGRCYVRKGSVNHQMTPVEIAECHLKATGASMDAVFVPDATKDDLDMEAVRRYMALSNARNRRNFHDGENPWNVLSKLEWVKSETEITKAAYLLFAKDPQRKFPQAIVHAGAFKANGAVVIDSHDARGNIQDQIDETMAFVQRNIRCALSIQPGRAAHVAVWDYPLKAVRETIANAICHRDYGSYHDVQLKILDEELVVSSPGQLPFDMPMELLMDPRHASRPRNRIIAQAFFDMGIIEHYGSGITRIKDECDGNGNKYPTWSDSAGEFVTVYMANSSNADQQDDAMPKGRPKAAQSSPKGRPKVSRITPLQQTILRLLREGPTTTRREIANVLPNVTQDMVKHNISRLQKMGFLKRVGPRFGGVWEVQIDFGDENSETVTPIPYTRIER